MSEVKQKRKTKQKQVIYDILRSTDSHPTAEWIYNEARRQIPNISLGTVYRNLQGLSEDGRILELNYGKGQSRYDGNISPHYHFVCEKCGRVIDFFCNAQPVHEAVLSAAPGMVVTYRLECYGVCVDCQKQNNMLY